MGFTNQNLCVCLLILLCILILIYSFNTKEQYADVVPLPQPGKYVRSKVTDECGPKNLVIDTSNIKDISDTRDTFLLKGNRYSINSRGTSSPSGSCGVTNPGPLNVPTVPDISQQCLNALSGGPFINWNVKYAAGANNTCGDKYWHYMSPRMGLIDNSMRCGEYNTVNDYVGPDGIQNDNTGDSLNKTPSGIPNETVIMYDDTLNTDEMKIGDMTGDKILSPENIPGYTLSFPRNNGLHDVPPMVRDCVTKRVEESYRCDCDRLGQCVPDFHKSN